VPSSPEVLAEPSPYIQSPGCAVASTAPASPISKPTIQRFRALFEGRDDAFGVSSVFGDVRADGKREANSRLEHRPLTEEDLRKHLAGERGVGILPARRDAGEVDFCCHFGVIDVDQYVGFDIGALARRAADRDRRLVVHRSKSGGAHIYYRASAKATAASMHEMLRQYADALNLPADVEIFPKPIDDNNPGGYPGGWINLPYFGATRPAIDAEGRQLSLEEFLDYAEVRVFDFVEEPEAPDKPPTTRHPKERRRYQNGAQAGNREQFLVSELARQLGAHPDWSAERLREYAEFLRNTLFEPRPSDDEWKGWRVPKLCARLVAKESAKRGDRPAGTGEISWYNALERTKGGEPLALLVNAMRAIEYAEEWRDALEYNEFIGEVVFREDSPEASASKGETLEEHHVTRICAWLQSQGIRVNVSTTGQAIYAVAMGPSKRVNPARAYFSGLEWDKTPRAERLFIDYFGAEDHAYTRAVSECFLISAVARVMRPGAKVDTMPVLESVQGDRKSQGVEKLVPREEWFADHLPSLADKDAVLQLRGKLIVEIGELKSLVGAKPEVVKAFLSRRIDTVRLPYGRKTVNIPRQTVFIGTTNKKDYLDDETGGRRFWPVKIGKVDVEAIERDRDQIWAEAVVFFRAGRKWWFDPEMEAIAAEVQESRRSADAWETAIAAWIENPTAREVNDEHGELLSPELLSRPRRVLTHEILAHCIGKPRSTWQTRDEMRVGAVLRGLGYERGKRTLIGGVRHRFYEPIEKVKGEQLDLLNQP